MATFKRI